MLPQPGSILAIPAVAAYSASAEAVGAAWDQGGVVKIGITLPTAEFDSGRIPRYADIRDAVLRAERDEFDSAWIMDHLLFQWGEDPPRGVWEGWTFLAALAEATTRIELGTLVLCSAFRNPALLAKMADAVDEVSGGRLILGLGAGWHEPEFTSFGYPFDHLASRFEEAMRITVPLLRTGAVDFQGVYERAVDCVNLPRGPRPAGPPILVGASRPRLLRLTAELADAWNTCWLGRAEELPERLAALHAACTEVGRDPKSLQVTVGQRVTFPGLIEANDGATGLERFTFTDPADLAAEWGKFAAQGVSHMLVWTTPEYGACLDQVTAALRLYRDWSPA